MKVCSWGFAFLILLFGILPALFVRERYYEAEVKTQARDPFWQSIRESARCRPLWGLIGTMFFLVLGSSAVASLGQYLSIYYVCQGNLAQAGMITGWKSTVVMITGIALIPVWTWLGEKFDKKIMVVTMLVISMVGHLMNLWCMTPAAPYLVLIPAVFESAAISAVWLFIPSMKGDIADYDELGTTRRREGSINAFFSWFFKGAMMSSLGLGGLILDLTGFNVKATAGQPHSVLHSMLWCYLVFPLVIWSLGTICVLRYPLTRERMALIRRTLESHRGKI